MRLVPDGGSDALVGRTEGCCRKGVPHRRRVACIRDRPPGLRSRQGLRCDSIWLSVWMYERPGRRRSCERDETEGGRLAEDARRLVHVQVQTCHPERMSRWVVPWSMVGCPTGHCSPLRGPQVNARSSGGLLALEPVSRLPGGVGNCHHFDAIWQFPKEDDVRKSLSYCPSEATISSPGREFTGCSPYPADDLVNATYKLITKAAGVSLVPHGSRLEFCACGGRERRRLHFECKRSRVSDLTCSQGMAFAVPASSSLTLRSSSVAQPAVQLASSGPSTLSRISVASASRSPAGRLSAPCRRSERLAFGMRQFYPEGRRPTSRCSGQGPVNSRSALNEPGPRGPCSVTIDHHRTALAAERQGVGQRDRQ